MKTQSNIGIKIVIEGFHNFPDASKIFDDSIKFLEYNHRHLFHIECKMTVNHLNRDREYFKECDNVKKYINEQYGTPAQFGSMSCEMIANELLHHFNFDYVKVQEDQENYSEVFKI